MGEAYVSVHITKMKEVEVQMTVTEEGEIMTYLRGHSEQASKPESKMQINVWFRGSRVQEHV